MWPEASLLSLLENLGSDILSEAVLELQTQTPSMLDPLGPQNQAEEFPTQAAGRGAEGVGKGQEPKSAQEGVLPCVAKVTIKLPYCSTELKVSPWPMPAISGF